MKEDIQIWDGLHPFKRVCISVGLESFVLFLLLFEGFTYRSSLAAWA